MQTYIGHFKHFRHRAVFRCGIQRMTALPSALVPVAALLTLCARPMGAQLPAHAADLSPAHRDFAFAHRRDTSCQAGAVASLPNAISHDAFPRLLYRLDHAPLDLNALEASARHGSRMSQTACSFAAIMAPALPVLDRVSHSPTLALLSRIPVIGKSCDIARLCLASGREIGTGFTNLVEMDKKHGEPLRQAIQQTTKLRRSRSPHDLAATVKSLDDASVPLQDYEQLVGRQRQGLTSLTAALKGLDAILMARDTSMPKRPSPFASTVQSLEKLNLALFMQVFATRQLHQYVATCAADGHEALIE